MLRLGYVAKVHSEDHSVDLVMCDDGTRLIGVQVMSMGGSTRTGHVDMPEVPQQSDPWSITQPNGQDQKAVVAFSKAGPIVMGFLLPQISQMTFKDGKRKMNRHQSDVYHTVDGDGNMELYHPSGAYARMGETLDHEDLTNKNFDESFKTDRNTDKKVGARMSIAGATVEVDKDGNFKLSIKNTEFTIDKDGNAKIKSDKTVTIDTPTLSVPNGDITVSGKVTAGGDVTAGSISLQNHVHSGVKPGPSITGAPQ